jgi:hypothetical protein
MRKYWPILQVTEKCVSRGRALRALVVGRVSIVHAVVLMSGGCAAYARG